MLNKSLSIKKQRVILNGQYSSWVDTRAANPEVPSLDIFCFFMYASESSNGLKKEYELIADEISLFPIAYDFNSSAKNTS